MKAGKNQTRARLILRPAADTWEALPAAGETGAAESGVDPLVWTGRADAAAIPVKAVFCLPLWILAPDEASIRPMVELQLERRGLLGRTREDTVFEWSRQGTRGEEMLVIVTVLPGVDGPWLRREARLYAPSPRFQEFPVSSAVLWKEEDTWVISVQREQPVYFQALLEKELSPAMAVEVRCILLQLEAEGVIEEEPSLIVRGVCTPMDLSALQMGTGCVSRREAWPPPVWPKRGDLVPTIIRQERQEAGRTQSRRKQLTVVGVLYLIFMLGWGGHTAWLAYQCAQLRNGLAADEPQIRKWRETADRWKALEPAISPERYPLDVLFRCTQALPADGVRFTLFSQETKRIQITGEATSAPMALQFLQKLKQQKELSKFRWEMGQPRLLPNDTAQFQISGIYDDAAPQ